MQLGFHPVAVVGKLVKKNRKETAIYKRRNNTKKQENKQQILKRM